MTGVARLNGLYRWLTQCDIWIKTQWSFLIQSASTTPAPAPPVPVSFTCHPLPLMLICPVTMSQRSWARPTLQQDQGGRVALVLNTSLTTAQNLYSSTPLGHLLWILSLLCIRWVSIWNGLGGIIKSELRLCLTLVLCLNRVEQRWEVMRKKRPSPFTSIRGTVNDLMKSKQASTAAFYFRSERWQRGMNGF